MTKVLQTGTVNYGGWRNRGVELVKSLLRSCADGKPVMWRLG